MPVPRPSTDPTDDDSAEIDYFPLNAVEKLERYRTGGYHPLEIGDTLGKHYRVIHKLGFGTYSTTWLAADKTSGKYVAIKVGAGYSNPLEMDVIRCLQMSPNFDADTMRSVIPPVLDAFETRGPNGKHPCYVTTAAGASLERAKMKSQKGLFRINVARAMAAQLVTAVAHVHEKGYVHGDVNLSNVLLHLPFDINKLSIEAIYEKYGAPVCTPVVRVDGQQLTSAVPRDCVQPVWLGKTSDEITLLEAKIVLIDFGESYIPSLQARHESNAPSAYQPPEALWDTRTPMTFASDIWTLACSLWDLVAWFPLFKSYFSAQDNITAEQVATLGRLPVGWWSTWGRKFDAQRKRFTLEGRPMQAVRYPDMETRFEHAVQQPRRDRDMEAMGDEEKEAFLSMLRSMLVFRPEGRVTARQVLESEWMVRWAIPEYEKVRSHSVWGDSATHTAPKGV
jgi:serine/threonine protein kinase